MDKMAILPSGLHGIVVGSAAKAADYAQENGIDTLVVDTLLISKKLLFRHPNLKIIGWANCDVEKDKWDLFANCHNLKHIVCVGNIEREKMKGHPIYKKASVIFPSLPKEILKNYSLIPYGNRAYNVVYQGAFVPCKGFAFLAKAWRTVLEQVPSAQLFVMGNGKLYGNIKTGPWGIAEEEMEAEIMQYLAPDGQNILPSVHFLGVLGKEKYDILAKCKVGVPNPGGETETFCISAAEMQMMGCRVTSIHDFGFLDSVCQKEDLYPTIEHLSDYIIRFLKETSGFDYNRVINYLDTFSTENVSIEWISLLKTAWDTSLLDRLHTAFYIFKCKTTTAIRWLSFKNIIQ